jgi:aklavinone 12-hydroxylase
MPIVDEAAVELGYRYRSSAIAAGADDDATWENPREPTGRPGFRAPHLPVEVGGAGRSTLDLFGRRFVVVAGSRGAGWTAAAQEASDALGVPLDAYRVGEDVVDPSGRIEDLYGTGPEGAALVRPDGFVAWRSSSAQTSPETELAGALAAAVARPALIAGS